MAPVLGGVLAYTYGFKAAFLVAAVLMLIGMVIVMKFIKPVDSNASSLKPYRESVRVTLSSLLIYLLIARSLLVLVNSVLLIFLPLYFTLRLQADLLSIGFYFLAPFSRISDHVGFRRSSC